MEVHLATVAPIACNGACPHLEDIDGAGFEALHSDCVGGAFYGRGVVLTELLLGTEKRVKDCYPSAALCSRSSLVTGHPVMPVSSDSTMLPMEAGIFFFCLGSGQVTCFGLWNILEGMRISTLQTLRVPDDLARFLCFRHLPGQGLEPGSPEQDLDPTLS